MLSKKRFMASSHIGVVYIASVDNMSGTEDDPADAIVTLRYDSDGGCRRSESTAGGSNTTDFAPWSSKHPNETDGASWWISVAYVSGDTSYVSGDALNSWHQLSTNRSWTFERDGTGTSNSVYSATLSPESDGTPIHDGPNNFNVTLFVDTP